MARGFRLEFHELRVARFQVLIVSRRGEVASWKVLIGERCVSNFIRLEKLGFRSEQFHQSVFLLDFLHFSFAEKVMN